jgi:hypothetical protein
MNVYYINCYKYKNTNVQKAHNLNIVNIADSKWN